MQVHRLIDNLARYDDMHLEFGHLESGSRNIGILRPSSNYKTYQKPDWVIWNPVLKDRYNKWYVSYIICNIHF